MKERKNFSDQKNRNGFDPILARCDWSCSTIENLPLLCCKWNNLIKQGRAARTVLIVCSYYVTYTCMSECTLCRWLNIKELLAHSRRIIWSLNNYNEDVLHNHLVHKQTLYHLTLLETHKINLPFSYKC